MNLLEKQTIASIFMLGALGAVGCGGAEREPTQDEATSESSEIRTETLGTVSAIKIGDQMVGRPSRVYRAVRALDIDNGEPWMGLPRCMGQNLDLFASDGKQIGMVLFCGSSLEGEGRDGYLTDTRGGAFITYRIHADLDRLASIAAEERVVWDHIWSSTSLVVHHVGDEPVELDGRAFRSAFAAMRPLQGIDPNPALTRCMPDWTFAVKRGTDTIAQVHMHCGDSPSSDEEAVLYDAETKLLGGIRINGEKIAELMRDARADAD